MRKSTILISLVLGLTACDQAPEQSKHTDQSDTKQSLVKPDSKEINSTESVKKESTSEKELNDEQRYPLFFIEVAKNLNITTQEFAQAMK